MKISYTLPVGNCAFVDDEALFPQIKRTEGLPSHGYLRLLQIINKLLGLFRSLKESVRDEH
jgi:hypothetical protein